MGGFWSYLVNALGFALGLGLGFASVAAIVLSIGYLLGAFGV